MSSVGPKQQVFAGLAQIAQALGNAHRLELLEHLGQGERSVEDLAARASLTIANASRHLQLLRRAALVEGRRAGKRVYYRLAGDMWWSGCSALSAASASTTAPRSR